MNKVTILCTIFLVLGAVSALPQKFQIHSKPRIIGGHDAAEGQFPHQVSYQWGLLGVYEHMCGGTIVGPKWILTAGHCVTEDIPIGDFRIVAGTINSVDVSNENAQIRTVVQKIAHPDFGGGVGPNDVALLEIDQELEFNDFVKAIDLPDVGADPNEANATLSGWGVTQNILPIPPAILQTVDMPVLSDEECVTALDALLDDSETNPYVNSSNICTGPLTGGTGACSGDSGSPLIQDGKIIGVVSWGVIPCALEGSVTVYTQVSNFIDFINEYVTKL